jgi:uncharacterized membrane protein (DUF106 family)
MTITTLLQSSPYYTLIAASIVITFISTLVTKWLTDQEHLRQLKKRQKEIQEELKKCSGNECKMKELQSEMLEITGKMMKSSFKPMLVTFIPFLLLFYFLRSVYSPVLGNWIWWYLGTSIASSIALRKLLKVA